MWWIRRKSGLPAGGISSPETAGKLATHDWRRWATTGE